MVDNVVLTVDIRAQSRILTGVDTVKLSRNEVSVRLVTESSGRGANCVVQNAGQRDFFGSAAHVGL